MAAGAVSFSHILAVGSTRQLLCSKGVEIPLHTLICNHLRGLFAAQFLPTPVAADIVRVVDLHSVNQKQTLPLTKNESKPIWRVTAWALAVQRLVNVSVLLLLLLVSVQSIEMGQLTSLKTALLLIWILVACCLVVVYLVSPTNSTRVLKRIQHWIPSPMTLSKTFLLGLGQQAALILSVLAAATGLGITAPTSHVMAVVPISLLAVILPVSINGLGVRESVYVFVLSQAGVPDSDSVTLSLSVYVLALGLSLLALTAPRQVPTEAATPSN